MTLSQEALHYNYGIRACNVLITAMHLNEMLINCLNEYENSTRSKIMENNKDQSSLLVATHLFSFLFFLQTLQLALLYNALQI